MKNSWTVVTVRYRALAMFTAVWTAVGSKLIELSFLEARSQSQQATNVYKAILFTNYSSSDRITSNLVPLVEYNKIRCTRNLFFFRSWTAMFFKWPIKLSQFCQNVWKYRLETLLRRVLVQLLHRWPQCFSDQNVSEKNDSNVSAKKTARNRTLTVTYAWRQSFFCSVVVRVPTALWHCSNSAQTYLDAFLIYFDMIRSGH